MKVISIKKLYLISLVSLLNATVAFADNPNAIYQMTCISTGTSPSDVHGVGLRHMVASVMYAYGTSGSLANNAQGMQTTIYGTQDQMNAEKNIIENHMKELSKIDSTLQPAHISTTCTMQKYSDPIPKVIALPGYTSNSQKNSTPVNMTIHLTDSPHISTTTSITIALTTIKKAHKKTGARIVREFQKKLSSSNTENSSIDLGKGTSTSLTDSRTKTKN